MPGADAKFLLAEVPPEARGRTDLAPLFSDEEGPGVRFAWGRTRELSGHYSRLYRELAALLTPTLSELAGLPPAAAAAFAREGVVPLTHYLLNRVLRLEAMLAQEPGTRWTVAASPAMPHPSRAERVTNLAAVSPRYNQLALVRAAPLFGLPVGECGALLPEHEREHASAKTFVNRNFAPSSWPQKLRRVALIAARRLTRRKAPLASLSMSYATDALKNAGFYGTALMNLRGTIPLVDGAPDAETRRALRRRLDPAAAPLAAFLSAGGSRVDPAAAHALFADFLAEAFPSSLLEAGRANLDAAMAALAPYRARPLVLSERGDLESIAAIAAAKVLGMKVIGAQHGGHGGFMADLAVALEMEHYHCDGYITWGWTRLPDYPPPPPQSIAVYDLPSPFLSERAKKWRRELNPRAEKRYDVLLLSNGAHRFTPAPACAGQSHVDFLHDCSLMLVDFAREAGRRGVSVLHKPRDPHAVAQLERTLAEMARAGGPGYSCTDRFDKGMTPEILDRCRVVVWDQPGMGFQECLAAGIPSMCLWKRIYNREEPSAEAAFRELESAGIIHRSAETLFAEVAAVRRLGGRAWLAEPARARAVARFVRAYGWAEDGWARRWAAFFDSL